MPQNVSVPRLLLIGPLPPPIGGATVLFELLVKGLAQGGGCELDVIDISRPPKKNTFVGNIGAAFRVLKEVIIRGPRADILSFHANERGRIFFGPLIWAVARMFRKPLIMRAFGGGFDKKVASLHPLHRWILHKSYFQADICLFETQNLVNYFRRIPGCRVEWFPNCTVLPKEMRQRDETRPCLRYVFVARMVPEKGVELLYQAEEQLPEGVTVDLYGPPDAYEAAKLRSRGAGRVRWRGVLSAAEVHDRLWEYDALVLPTYHAGEGYPAAILEAYAHGMPVITTRWRSIPEIVDDSSGVLIAPKDVAALVGAIKLLSRDQSLYRRLCAGAALKAVRFSDRERSDQFLGLCHRLLLPSVDEHS
jgi:glycosyltransferase involved in cell wall biosynthesis